MNPRIKQWWQEQWPFWVSGLAVGGAEVLYYARYHTIITFTTSLGKMFAGVEKLLFPTRFLSRAFEPDINWVLLGVFLGGFLVALAEREFRSWVKYDRRALIFAFSGAVLFSFGTRLAGGCTTRYVLGGLAAMNVASFVVALLMFVSGMLAFGLYARMGLAHLFKPQENRWYVVQAREFGLAHDASVLDEGYHPRSDPWRITLLAFLSLFLILLGVGAVRSDWPHGLRSLGVGEIFYLLLVGIIAGIGIGKTGFGTDCALLTPEFCRTMANREDLLLKLKMNYLMRNFFLGMFPFTAVLLAVVLLNVAILFGWLAGGIPLPASSEPWDYLNWGHIAGAVLMSFGSVFMLGCEIRNYARLGLGYSTALAALPGFLVGYLPYVGFKETLDAWTFGHPLLGFTSLPLLVSGKWGQIGISFLYTLLLIVLLAVSMRIGVKGLGLSCSEVNSMAVDRLMLKKMLRGHSVLEWEEERSNQRERVLSRGKRKE